ncbi:heterokaryon incompatibility protein-domain-containing protein [Lasiosphaeria hispida]|uniref:Heterokaryon incompatibility protein-domain-containing protein n=1 Tax=Lasiosphaeria hispida TaxID=260671 RepID=A0AAJ0MEZ9_9PEZI|nr:heterokaryon incompatibility protein-domain-containing protein [Lasiosphaeria hispida]
MSFSAGQSIRTQYEALSLLGETRMTESAIINGQPDTITKNLHSALIHLRYPERRRLLSVDALCINQDDIKERGGQVSKMGSIYSGAKNVLVWLGEETPDVKSVFSSMRMHASAKHTKEYTGHRPLVLEPNPYRQLPRRPWFIRTWVVQEAVLGRNLFMFRGSDMIDWDTFARYYEEVETLDSAQRPAHNHDDLTPIFLIQRETGRHEHPTVDDKVFGILGITNGINAADVEALGINYQASAEDLFEKVATWDIVNNESLEVFRYCSRGSESSHDSNLPSWVPNLANLDEAVPFRFSRVDREKYQKRNPGFQNGHTVPSFIRENGKTALLVSGAMVDTTARIGSPVDSFVDFSPPSLHIDADTDAHTPNMEFETDKDGFFWRGAACILRGSRSRIHHLNPKIDTHVQQAFWESFTFGLSFDCFNRLQGGALALCYDEKATR